MTSFRQSSGQFRQYILAVSTVQAGFRRSPTPSYVFIALAQSFSAKRHVHTRKLYPGTARLLLPNRFVRHLHRLHNVLGPNNLPPRRTIPNGQRPCMSPSSCIITHVASGDFRHWPCMIHSASRRVCRYLVTVTLLTFLRKGVSRWQI